MKKTLLALSLFATTAFAEPTEVYGSTRISDLIHQKALACTIAEEKAKEAAILKKVGEIVEIMLNINLVMTEYCDHIAKDFREQCYSVIIRSII